MRILFVLPSLNRGGAETQVLDLIDGLIDLGHKCELVTFERIMDQLDRVEELGIKHHRLTKRHKFDLTVPLSISKIISESNFDCIHATLQIAIFFSWVALSFSSTKVPLVSALHTTTNRSPKYDFLDKYVHRWALQKSTKVVYVCKSQKEYWLTKFPSLGANSIVIYNGIDVDRFDPEIDFDQSLKADDLAGKFVVSCIAGFRPEKGHAFLLQAFDKFHSRFPHSHLLLAGAGQTIEHVKGVVDELDIADSVTFLGLVNDVRPVLHCSDVMCLPSTSVETFSLSILEALCMNTPVVATEIGGAMEVIVNDVNGVLVAPGSSDALFDALVRIHKVYLNGDKFELRDEIAQTYSKESMVQNYHHLFESLKR